MAPIEWTQELSVGVEALDQQHQNLVAIVNKFNEGRRRGKGTKIMTQILNEMVGYTQEHFAFEEQMMEAAGYEGLKLHQSQHRQLLQKLERFQFDFLQENRRITSDVAEFLNYWLTSHILKHDKEYTECLQAEPANS